MGYDLVAGDPGSKLVVPCKDNQTQGVIDLTGKTVQIRYKIDAGALQIKTMTVQAPGTDGKAEYQFGVGDLTPGTMEAEVRLQNGLSDQITSVSTMRLSVRAALS